MCISNSAKQSNLFISDYIIALNHSFLWIAALSFAGFFHVSPWFSHKQALLFSTLVAYSAYLCESGLSTWRVATSQINYFINFRKAALWKYICLNVAINLGLAILFLKFPTWWLILAVIFTAGWQKYMDGRIPPRLQSTMILIEGNKFISKIL